MHGPQQNISKKCFFSSQNELVYSNWPTLCNGFKSMVSKTVSETPKPCFTDKDEPHPQSPQLFAIGLNILYVSKELANWNTSLYLCIMHRWKVGLWYYFEASNLTPRVYEVTFLKPWLVLLVLYWKEQVRHCLILLPHCSLLLERLS